MEINTPVTRRLASAVTLSLALHLALALSIRVRPAPPPPPVAAMEVRFLTSPAPVAVTVHEASSEALPSAPHTPAPAAPPPSLLPTVEVPLVEDPTYYPAKQLDVHPAALQAIRPVYPDAPAQKDVEGHVILLLLIDESGAVREASVVESTPEGAFDESALTAFRHARFSPAQRNGRIVKSRVLIRVSYELDKRKTEP